MNHIKFGSDNGINIHQGKNIQVNQIKQVLKKFAANSLNGNSDNNKKGNHKIENQVSQLDKVSTIIKKHDKDKNYD